MIFTINQQGRLLRDVTFEINILYDYSIFSTHY